MSDITNPGLVNVADQAFKPDLKVDSLAIPLDDDVLVPVANQDIDPVTGNPLSVAFPTPAESIVSTSSQAPRRRILPRSPASLPFTCHSLRPPPIQGSRRKA